MNTLKTIYRLYRLFVRHLPVVTNMEGWSEADAQALSDFLITRSGRKLRQIRWERLYQSQVEAVKDRSESAYSKGVSWGMRALIAFEDSLLQIRQSEAESQTETYTEEQEGRFLSVNR